MIDVPTHHRRPVWAAVMGAWVLVLAVALTGLAAAPSTPAASASASASASIEAGPSASIPPECLASPSPSPSVRPTAHTLPSRSAEPSAQATGIPGPGVGLPSASPAIDPCPEGSASSGQLPGASATPTVSPTPTLTPRATATPESTPRATPRPTPKPSHARRPGKVRVKTGIAYMRRMPCAESSQGCVNRADVYYPTARGPWPVIVTIHGRPRTQRDMAEVARALAAKGAVVFNVDYRGVRPAYTKGFPESITDVACAVRFARSAARQFGGDGGDVVLVGHSQGGYVGAMVALAGDTFRSDRAACRSRRPLRDSLPEGFVSVAGVSGIHTTYRIDQAFLGGTRARIPEVWRRATVYTHIGRNRRLKVGIIFERHDPYLGIGHATMLHAALKRARYDVRMVLLDQGTTHFDILDTDLAIGRQTVALVWRIVRKVKDS